jgi:hypothetical protein
VYTGSGTKISVWQEDGTWNLSKGCPHIEANCEGWLREKEVKEKSKRANTNANAILNSVPSPGNACNAGSYTNIYYNITTLSATPEKTRPMKYNLHR